MKLKIKNKKGENRLFVKNKKCECKFLIKDKKGMEKEVIGWLIFFVIVLIIVLFSVMIFTDKGNSAIEYIKNLFRFGA